jgi:ATP-dependent Clp protease ATP-binding subunit ClpC
VDFRNTVLIMTSNIGADLIKGGGGFGFGKKDTETNFTSIKDVLMKEIERFFRPEFINRLDDVIVFRPLTKDDLVTIVEYETAKVRERIEERGHEFEIDQKAKDFLIEKGYNPDFGARPLRRAIGTYIEDPISEMLLAGDIEKASKITVTHEEGKDHLRFENEPLPEPKKEKAEDKKEEEAAASSSGESES